MSGRLKRGPGVVGFLFDSERLSEVKPILPTKRFARHSELPGSGVGVGGGAAEVGEGKPSRATISVESDEFYLSLT